MFHDIPRAVLDRMRALEAADARDRVDGTPHLKRLRQVPPATGKFLAILAASAPEGSFLEIGTSAGYSSLWMGLACQARGARLTTFEVLPEKAALAGETFRSAGMDSVVRLVLGDARDHLPEWDRIAFCFLDAEKEVYQDCYDLIVPRMVAGGLLVADNVTSHAEVLAPFINRALADERVDALVVPIERGLLLCRRA
jgi:predicted O-methyltransferase YrrM